MKHPLFLAIVGGFSALYGAAFSAVASKEDFFKGLGNGLGGEQGSGLLGGEDVTKLLLVVGLCVAGMMLIGNSKGSGVFE